MNKKKIKKLIIYYVNGTKDIFLDLEDEKNFIETQNIIEISNKKQRTYIMKNNILKWVIEYES